MTASPGVIIFTSSAHPEHQARFDTPRRCSTRTRCVSIVNSVLLLVPTYPLYPLVAVAWPIALNSNTLCVWASGPNITGSSQARQYFQSGLEALRISQIFLKEPL